MKENISIDVENPYVNPKWMATKRSVTKFCNDVLSFFLIRSVSKCRSCRSRETMKNAPFLASIGVDTTEI